METRRRNYRHSFGYDDPLTAELASLESSEVFVGEVENLSTSGMRVQLAKVVPLASLPKKLMVRVNSAQIGPVFSAIAHVVYAEVLNEKVSVGLSFLESANTRADENRERIIWQFLLEAQRRFIRRRKNTIAKYETPLQNDAE